MSIPVRYGEDGEFEDEVSFEDLAAADDYAERNAPMTEQLTLAPERPPVFVDERVPLDELPPDNALVGPPPDKALVDSIRRFGIIEPVILEEVDGRYLVTDGRRRVKAARKAGLDTIPVRIYDSGDDDGWMPSAITVMSHATRKDNPVCEYLAIRELVDAGYSEKAIAEATGLSVQTIRQRFRFANLNPIIREAAAGGNIAPGVALQAAKLPKDQQEPLAKLYASTGKLTGKDVREAQMVRRQEAAEALSFDAINAVPDITSDTTGDGAKPELHKAVVDLLDAWDGSASFNTLEPLIERVRDTFKRASLEGVI